MSQIDTRLNDPIADPQPVLSPVRSADRLFSLDVVRGLAVLGILANAQVSGEKPPWVDVAGLTFP